MNKAKTGIASLAIAALGVVFGDIGTSPLYAIQAIFSPLGQNLAVNNLNVYGIISLVFWAVTIVVSIKYIGFIMRADNRGEGGIISLVALLKNSELAKKNRSFFIVLGLIGVSLFYGDSAITPAISVLSAVEGLRVVAPHLSSYILPATLVILALLFYIQRYGSAFIGRLFGPIMLLWFITIGAAGAWRILQHPEIIKSLSPLPAIQFFAAQPLIAFIAMGAVILVVTGAEALYADMGHFGRPPIARAWFFLVFPALTLCYMGQGALLLIDPSTSTSTFILLFPEALRFSMVLLATAATLIASQAVISGAFSLTRQAVQLDFLPKMLIRHTSDRETGQVFLPFVNAALFVAVMVLVLLFGSSEKLAVAYGFAVSGTFLIDTILFIVVARALWKKSISYILLVVAGFLLLDLLFVAANLSKIIHGGWFPLLAAVSIFILLDTWLKGQRIINRERKNMEGPLQDFINKIRSLKPPITRVPGQAVYISHHAGLAPLALHASIEELHELHEKVVIVSVNITNEAHVPMEERAVFDDLGFNDGISHLTLSYGFHDSPNIPKTLKSLRHVSPELNFNPDHASFFVSQSKVVPSKRLNMSGWRKSLYGIMARNSLSTSDYFKLPTDRTIEIRSLIEL